MCLLFFSDFLVKTQSLKSFLKLFKSINGEQSDKGEGTIGSSASTDQTFRDVEAMEPFLLLHSEDEQLNTDHRETRLLSK